jgi:hypothetical protein
VRPRPKKAAGCALVVGVIGALPMTSAAGSERDEPGRLPAKPSALTGQAPCHAGKHNGFRLYCHVAVKFKLDARKFSYEGGSCGHRTGASRETPLAMTMPSVHFGTQDYGKAVDKDGKYGPATVTKSTSR